MEDAAASRAHEEGLFVRKLWLDFERENERRKLMARKICANSDQSTFAVLKASEMSSLFCRESG
jgi:hypothetical protein